MYVAINSNYKDGESKMKINNKLNRVQLIAATLCFGASLGMSIFIGSSSTLIGLMLGAITVSVYVMIISGKWSGKSI